MTQDVPPVELLRGNYDRFTDATAMLRGAHVGVDFDPTYDLRPGHAVTRAYHGESHVVFVVYVPRSDVCGGATITPSARARGWWRYWYRGQRYRTLSAVASAITGKPLTPGARFFGLRRLRRGGGR